MSEKSRPRERQLGPARGLLGLEVLDLAVGRDDEHAAEHRPADEDALVLEVGHDDPRAARRLDADRLLEADQEAALEQLPAQVVGDLQARARPAARRRSGAASGRSAGRRARRGPGSSARRRGTRPAACAAPSSSGPCSVLTMRKSVRRSVGELNALEAFCSATSRGTRRTSPPAAGRGSARSVVFLTIARPTSGAWSAAPKTNGEERERPGRRAARSAGARPRAGPRASSSRGASGAACSRRRRAAASGGSQTSGAVQNIIARPCQIGRTSHSADETDDDQDQGDGPDGKGPETTAAHCRSTLLGGTRAGAGCLVSAAASRGALSGHRGEGRIRTSAVPQQPYGWQTYAGGASGDAPTGRGRCERVESALSRPSSRRTVPAPAPGHRPQGECRALSHAHLR